MKLSWVRIENFKACRNVELNLGDLHAILGANNAGKSCILKALDFLFNPSARMLNEESFWDRDTRQEIRVEAIFRDLTLEEAAKLGPYLRPDRTFHMARTAQLRNLESGDGAEDEEKKPITAWYCRPQPRLEWLCESEINANNIKSWWQNQSSLTVGDISFVEFLGSPRVVPKVSDWKEKAEQFRDEYEDLLEWEDRWVRNPQGYANVLKSTLPFFLLVPAVRDVTDESKANRTNPFGRLIFAVLDNVAGEERERILRTLNEVAEQFNRSDRRLPVIKATEDALRNLLKEFFHECDLEIEFQTPTFEVLLSTPRIFVDDGFRNLVENKGHGLQRAVMFSILRRYAEHVAGNGTDQHRSIILAVEEPELYMHPQAQRTIRRVFKRIASGGDQVFYSTHSALLVDVADFDEIIRVEACRSQKNGNRCVESRVWQLSMDTLIEDLKLRHPGAKPTDRSLRDHYSHAYNPRRNEGFFANRVILVEGTTEEYALPIYAEALDGCEFDVNGISVIECGGKDNMDRLFRVFNGLGIPCYMIFDYDRSNNDASRVAKSRELLRLVGERTDDPDGVYVGELAACFPENWETTLKEEIPGYEELCAAARNELRKDGKPLLARYIARKVTREGKKAVPSSLEKIIRESVKVEWKSSCLKRSSPGMPAVREVTSPPPERVLKALEILNE